MSSRKSDCWYYKFYLLIKYYLKIPDNDKNIDDYTAPITIIDDSVSLILEGKYSYVRMKIEEENFQYNKQL